MHNRLMNNIAAGLSVYCLAASFFIFGKKDGAEQPVKGAENCRAECKAVHALQTAGANNTICLLATVSTR
jgi:hypothetical protein